MVGIMHTKKIKAVFEPELEKILRQLGIWDKLQNHELKCSLCGDSITLNNLQYIFPHKNRILVGCGKAMCVEKIVTFKKEHEY